MKVFGDEHEGLLLRQCLEEAAHDPERLAGLDFL